MSDLQVRCTNKTSEKHEAIANLGGDWGKYTTPQVIARIESKSDTFHTTVGGKRADVGVVNGPNGKYVRTYADGQWNNNLLALPQCIG